MPRAKKSASSDYVFALADVHLREPGSKYSTLFKEGQAYWADHPVVKANPAAFGDHPPKVYPLNWSPPVEQATAAPGEYRVTSRES